MALLRLGGYEAAAGSAAESAPVDKGLHGFAFLGLRLAFTLEHLLALVEQGFRYERLMFALIKLAPEPHKPVVDRVLEHVLIIGNGKRAALPGPLKPHLVHGAAQLRQGIIARGVQLKGFADKLHAVLIRQDGLGFKVVYIAERSAAGPGAVAQFLPEAAVNVLRKIINVVFALAESDRKHELPLRRGVEPEGRELQGRYLADVHQVDNAPAVYGVAGQPVRVPGHYTLGRALLHLGYHVVE
ncbi:MAG: hypothetical protein A2X32_02300 [Elusimicrobia bacterium GWC2_64_44]|nr:MAG: hypothetical protein A2X32_02300 [Elusimicrobia bacterium GWC2_64_44]